MPQTNRGGTSPAQHLVVSALLIAGVGAAWFLVGAPAGLGAALAGLLLLWLFSFRSILRDELARRKELEQRLPLLEALRDAAAEAEAAERAEADAEAAGPGDSAGVRSAVGSSLLPSSSLRRRFAIGTVAVLCETLDPDQVETVVREQRRRPGRRFGLVAVELGLLSLTQLADLVRAQQEGRFSILEMRRARKRLVEARRRQEQAADPHS